MTSEILFSNPVPPYTIRTPYGTRGKWWSWSLNRTTGQWTKGKTDGLGNHTGYDFPCPIKTRCLAVADGVIVYSDTKHPKAGTFIVLKTHGLNVSYAHLTTIDIKTGAKVKRGDYIGLSGKTGNVTGPHLHISFRKPTGQWVGVKFMPTAYSPDSHHTEKA